MKWIFLSSILVGLLLVLVVIVNLASGSSGAKSNTLSTWTRRLPISLNTLIFIASLVLIFLFWGDIEDFAASSSWVASIGVTPEQVKNWLWLVVGLVAAFLYAVYVTNNKTTAKWLAPVSMWALWLIVLLAALNFHYGSETMDNLFTSEPKPDPSHGTCTPYEYSSAYPPVIPYDSGRCLLFWVGETRDVIVKVPDLRNRLIVVVDGRTVKGNPEFFKAFTPNEVTGRQLLQTVRTQTTRVHLRLRSDILKEAGYQNGAPIMFRFYAEKR